MKKKISTRQSITRTNNPECTVILWGSLAPNFIGMHFRYWIKKLEIQNNTRENKINVKLVKWFDLNGPKNTYTVNSTFNCIDTVSSTTMLHSVIRQDAIKLNRYHVKSMELKYLFYCSMSNRIKSNKLNELNRIVDDMSRRLLCCA